MLNLDYEIRAEFNNGSVSLSNLISAKLNRKLRGFDENTAVLEFAKSFKTRKVKKSLLGFAPKSYEELFAIKNVIFFIHLKYTEAEDKKKVEHAGLLNYVEYTKGSVKVYLHSPLNYLKEQVLPPFSIIPAKGKKVPFEDIGKKIMSSIGGALKVTSKQGTPIKDVLLENETSTLSINFVADVPVKSLALDKYVYKGYKSAYDLFQELCALFGLTATLILYKKARGLGRVAFEFIFLIAFPAPTLSNTTEEKLKVLDHTKNIISDKMKPKKQDEYKKPYCAIMNENKKILSAWTIDSNREPVEIDEEKFTGISSIDYTKKMEVPGIDKESASYLGKWTLLTELQDRLEGKVKCVLNPYITVGEVIKLQDYEHIDGAWEKIDPTYHLVEQSEINFNSRVGGEQVVTLGKSINPKNLNFKS